MKDFYDYKGKLIEGKEVDFKEFEGKVVLIVNTASKWGFTPQFQDLEQIYRKFKDDGFTVLGFPSGDFGDQELDTNDEILDFAVENYDVTFPMFEKSHISKKDGNELFQWLVEQKGGLLTEGIKWNFTKFLIDRRGNVVERYAPSTKPSKIISDIEKIL